jgi:iron complex outermembrane receptor protein
MSACKSLYVAAALLAGVSLVSASHAADDDATMQEIIVTSQKRSENLETVPMSITALTAVTLQSAGIESFVDYATKIPNLTFSTGNNYGAVNSRGVAIRGIQGADTTGFYVDDLPVPLSLDPRVVDLARIEVLRGPQGTLYGARSMGGTVRLITTVPNTDDFTIDTHVQGTTLEGGGNGYQVDATINVPLIKDHLALRITPYSGTDGGFENREFPNPPGASTFQEVKNVGRDDFYGTTATLQWNPTDNLTIKPKVMYQLSSTNGLPLGDYYPGNDIQVRHFDIPEENLDRWTDWGLVIDYKAPLGTVTSATSVFDRVAHESEDVTEYTQAAISGYSGITLPFYPSPILATESNHVTVEELRFASDFKGPVQFIGGLYYSKSTYIIISNNTMPGYNAVSGGALGTDVMYYEWAPTHQEERAAFGEVTYSFNSEWSATVGGRFSRDSEDQGGYQYGYLVGTGNTPSPIMGAEAESRFTPKYLVKYMPTSDVTLYGSASQGFRPGGSQAPPPASICAADYARLHLTPEDLSTFKGDSVWNYELGSKLRFRDPRITLNSSLFWINWTDTRQTLVLDCTYPVLINAGRSRSRGGELEVTANPIDSLTLTGSLGYTDAKILSAGPLVSIPPPGSAIQQVAPWTGAFSADYKYPLSDTLQGVARLDYSYVDHSYSATITAGSPRLRQSYELLNLRAGIVKGPWETVVFVNNVTDTRQNLGDYLSLDGEAPGRPRWLTGPPRTVGIDLRMHF